MNCIHCNRQMAQPYVVATGGPLGPKCAAKLGVKRAALSRSEARLARPRSRGRRSDLQLDLFGAAA